MRSNKLRTDRRRVGMTMIEIMVVIAIIAVLVSLLVVGIMAAMGKGTVAQNRADIDRLKNAVEAFKTKTGIYPPNQILLCASTADYAAAANQALAQQSLAVITKIWPNIINPATGGFTGLNWAGYDINVKTGTTTAVKVPAAGITLDGDQCLVFFLGGIPFIDNATNPPTVVKLQGFSTIGSGAGVIDPTALPAAAQKGGDRMKFFDFDMNRLYFRTGHILPSFNDAFSHAQSRFHDVAIKIPAKPKVAVNKTSARPLVYFSSTQASNAPNSYDPTTQISFGPDTVAPYQTKAGHFANANSFQIISAGEDGLFGPGGVWTPGNYLGFGSDDMSNFSSNTLNVP